MPSLYYIHDPMCSWCFGFSNTLASLIEQLPSQIKVTRLLGGLAPDTDALMTAEMQQTIKGNWQRIEKSIPGVYFNFDFWINCQPRRSTYQSCRAVIAAREQGAQYDEIMTKAIQQAYYQQARNPSDDEVLILIAKEIDLDVTAFTESLSSNQTQQILQDEIMQSADMGVGGYPSLRLETGGTIWPVSINYNDAGEIIDLIDSLL